MGVQYVVVALNPKDGDAVNVYNKADLKIEWK